MIVADLLEHDARKGTALYVVRRFDLGEPGRACAIPCAGYAQASIMIVPVTGSWTLGVVRVCVSNTSEPSSRAPHWLGYRFTLLGTHPAITDAIPLAHRWLVLEVITIQAGVIADMYVHLSRGDIP